MCLSFSIKRRGIFLKMNHTSNIYKFFKIIVIPLGCLLLLTQIIRLIFFSFNYTLFDIHSISEYLQIVFYSIRFDLSSIFTINLLYIAIASLPFAFIQHKRVRTFLFILFFVSNLFAFVFDIIDIAYYPYVHKRMTADVFHLIGKKSDFINLLPNYMSSFWYIILLILGFGMLFYVVCKRIFKEANSFQWNIKSILRYLLLIAISIIAIRGGLQLRPITLSNASIIRNNKNVLLVCNTPFSILKTFENEQIHTVNILNNDEVNEYFHPIKNYQSNIPFQKKNVVFIILESFGKQFTSIGGRKSFTPFLDSLMQKSETFTNAYANGVRSSDGIPAVLSSIPFFTDDSYPMSAYSNNKTDAIALLLKQKGYHTSFFHGGTNGTMNFDSYSVNAGFEKYIGRNEYNNDNDYDGTWGIWDEAFLQFFAQNLNKEKQPFCSAVFTLSSHEPFHLPSKYKNTYLEKLQGIERGVAYTDMALQKFFETASKAPWYQNTVFVLVADHNFLAYNDPQQYYNQGMGIFSIPILFFEPQKSIQKNNTHLMQQIDIAPSILDYLHFDKPFFCFGKSVYDTLKTSFLYTHINNQNFYYQTPHLLLANNENIEGYYNFKQDSLLKINNIDTKDSSFTSLSKYYFSFYQSVYNHIIDNTQSYKKP